MFKALSKIWIAKIYMRTFVSASEDKGQVLIKPGKERRSLEQSENVGTDHQDGKGSRRATGSNQHQPKRKLARETGAPEEAETQVEADSNSTRKLARVT